MLDEPPNRAPPPDGVKDQEYGRQLPRPRSETTWSRVSRPSTEAVGELLER
jgi:hypothetical protein